jgi:hypothetical protein
MNDTEVAREIVYEESIEDVASICSLDSALRIAIRGEW